jgi:16S rRNA processing protein RimM
MKPLLPVGEIVGVHGLNGTLKVRSHFEEDSIFRAGTRLFLQDARGRGSWYTIEWARPHKRLLLVALENLRQRESAEALVGAKIFTERTALPEPAEGEYYWSDLIGLAVYSTDGQYLGRLEDIIATGSNDVYVVRDGDRETLLPALERVVKEIDIEQGLMRVELPEGL